MSTQAVGAAGAPPEHDAALNEAERRLWFAWKRAVEVVRMRTAEEVRAATGVSDADVAVLIHTADAGGLRQNQLATRLGWDRTRVSHQVSRMQQRGLVDREKTEDGGVTVHLTAAGRHLVDLATPVHAAAVRRQLIEPLTASQVQHLQQALDLITEPRRPRPASSRSRGLTIRVCELRHDGHVGV